MLERFSSSEAALLPKHICSKRLQPSGHQVLRYSCLWDPPRTARAVIKCCPVFWAPCICKELRAPFTKVSPSAAPGASIQPLAPERNLRCHIKHRSFPRECVSPEVDFTLPSMMGGPMPEAALSQGCSQGHGQWDGLENPSPPPWMWPTLSRTWHSQHVCVAVVRNSAHSGYLRHKRRHKREKTRRCGVMAQERRESVPGRSTWCTRRIRERGLSSRSKNWMFLIPVPESGCLQIGVAKLGAATP